MPIQSRPSSFITITSLAKYLTYGEQSCGLAAWFPAHYTYQKLHFDNADYQLQHDALLARVRGQVTTEGFLTAVEDENSFIARGRMSGIKVSGRPDLVAVDAGAARARILDVKTGSPRPEHATQVRLYMLFARWIPLLASTFSQGQELQVEGVVVYRSGATCMVPPIDADFRARVGASVTAIGGAAELPANPSQTACTYCAVPTCERRFDPDRDTLLADGIFE